MPLPSPVTSESVALFWPDGRSLSAIILTAGGKYRLALDIITRGPIAVPPGVRVVPFGDAKFMVADYATALDWPGAYELTDGIAQVIPARPTTWGEFAVAVAAGRKFDPAKYPAYEGGPE